MILQFCRLTCIIKSFEKGRIMQWAKWNVRGSLSSQFFTQLAYKAVGYIPQYKVSSASSNGSMGFIVSVQCYRMVDSVPIRHIRSLSCSQYGQTSCWCEWDYNACLGVRNTISMGLGITPLIGCPLGMILCTV